MSGMTSQPNLNSTGRRAAEHAARQRAGSARAQSHERLLGKAVRAIYYPFEEDIKSGTAEVYQHEMPGGQYTNLKQQAKSLHLGDRWNEIAEAYATVNMLFGDIVKVTPSSKVVGDMALFMVTNDLTAKDVLTGSKKLAFPKSVVEMMQGAIGQPDGGWPKVLQRIILDSAGVQATKGRPGAKMEKVDIAATKKELVRKIDHPPTDDDVQSYLMYPQVYLDYEKHNETYGNTSVIPSSAFFYGLQSGEEVGVEIEPGKQLIVRFLTTGDAHDDGTRTVFFELNGIPRDVNVPDKSPRRLRPSPSEGERRRPESRRRADAWKSFDDCGEKGQPVKEGERLLSIEAMKMETAVYAPRDATVADILVKPGSVIVARDLLVVLE